MPDLTIEQLEHLAQVAGTAAGRAHAETLLEAEEQVQAQMPLTPVDQAASNLLAQIPTWAEEAARMPRSEKSEQAKLLALALTYRAALKQAKADGEQAGGTQP